MEKGKDKGKFNLDLKDYEKEGLYLIFEDSTKLELTKENIDKVSGDYWRDESKVPEDVKNSLRSFRCSHCPRPETGYFCRALRPIIPLISGFEKYVSYSRVKALYKDKRTGLLHVRETALQNALRYISIMSLTQYCEFGKRYRKFYLGIIPTINGPEMARRLYLNAYWIYRGNRGKIIDFLAKFKEEMLVMSQSQANRIRLLTDSDVFTNAFANAQITVELLSLDMDQHLNKQFEKYAGEVEK